MHEKVFRKQRTSIKREKAIAQLARGKRGQNTPKQLPSAFPRGSAYTKSGLLGAGDYIHNFSIYERPFFINIAQSAIRNTISCNNTL